MVVGIFWIGGDIDLLLDRLGGLVCRVRGGSIHRMGVPALGGVTRYPFP